MRTLLPFIFLLAACGASVAPESFKFQDGETDLNRTAYIFEVRANPMLKEAFDQVRIEKANVTGAEGYSPSSDFPLKIARTFPVETPRVGPDGSATTFTFTLYGPPRGKLYARILGLHNGTKGVACVAGIDVPDDHTFKVSLQAPPGVACNIP